MQRLYSVVARLPIGCAIFAQFDLKCQLTHGLQSLEELNDLPPFSAAEEVIIHHHQIVVSSAVEEVIYHRHQNNSYFSFCNVSTSSLILLPTLSFRNSIPYLSTTF